MGRFDAVCMTRARDVMDRLSWRDGGMARGDVKINWRNKLGMASSQHRCQARDKEGDDTRSSS